MRDEPRVLIIHVILCVYRKHNNPRTSSDVFLYVFFFSVYCNLIFHWQLSFVASFSEGKYQRIIELIWMIRFISDTNSHYLTILH